MGDERPTADTGLPQYRAPGKRAAGQRHRTKVWEALIVTTGLALSTALYPLPAIAPLLELSPPKYETSDFPALVRSAVANRRIAEASGRASNLTDIVEVIDNDVLVLRTDTLLELVNTRGLPDTARSLELLRSFQSLTQGHPLALSGGGGGGGTTVNVPSTTLPELWTLLELLLEALPTSANHQLAAVLTELLPLLAQSLGLSGPPGVPPLDTKVFTQDESTVHAPLPQLTVTPTAVPDPTTQAPTKPADAPPQAPAPAQSAVPAPTATPTEAPIPAPPPTVETPTSSEAPPTESAGTPTASPTAEPTSTPTAPSTPSSTPSDNGSGPTDVTEPEDDRETTSGTPSQPDDDDEEPASEPPKSSEDKPSEPNDKPDNENSAPGS